MPSFFLPHTFFFFVNHNAAPLPTVQSEIHLQILIRHYTAPSGATQGFMQLLFTFTIYTDVSFLASSTCSMAFCYSEIGVCYINVRWSLFSVMTGSLLATWCERGSRVSARGNLVAKWVMSIPNDATSGRLWSAQEAEWSSTDWSVWSPAPAFNMSKCPWARCCILVLYKWYLTSLDFRCSPERSAHTLTLQRAFCIFFKQPP